MGVFLVILSSAATVVGSVFAKQWSEKSGLSYFLLTQLFYLIGALVFPFALRYGTLAMISAIAGLATAMVTAGIGIWIYHEQLTGIQIAGAILSFIAIGMLTIPFKT